MDDSALYDAITDNTSDNTPSDSGVTQLQPPAPVNPQQPVPAPTVQGSPTPDTSAVNNLAASAGVTSGTTDLPRFQRTFGNTLKGILMGMAQGGIPGAVVGGISPTTVQANADRNASMANAKVKFESAQAANMVSEAAIRDQTLHNLPQEQQDAHNAASLQQMKELQSMGIQPTLVTDNNKGGTEAMTGLQQLTDSHGAVPPLFTLNLGHQIVAYDLNQMTQAPMGLDQVNKVRSVQGLPAIDQKTWQQVTSTPQGKAQAIEQLNSALNFFNPAPSEQNLAMYQNYVNTLKAQPASPERDANLAKLQTVVGTMTKTLDAVNKRATQQKVTDANQITSQTAQADASAAGMKAEATARGTAKGQIEGQMSALGGGNGTGEDFLKTLPPARANYVRGVVDGRIEITPRMMQTKDGQLLTQQVVQAFPGFDMSRAPAYFQARKGFTSGKEAKGMNALNTAIGHLGHLNDVTSFTATFPVVSGIARSMGGNDAKAFEYYKSKVNEEIQQAYVQGALTDRDKADADKQLSEWTPSNVRQGEKALATLLVSKLQAYQTQWDSAKPSSAIPDFPVISQANIGIIKRITGQDVQGITPQGSRTTQPITHTGTVPTGARPIMRNGQAVGYIQNGQRVDF